MCVWWGDIDGQASQWKGLLRLREVWWGEGDDEAVPFGWFISGEDEDEEEEELGDGSGNGGIGGAIVGIGGGIDDCGKAFPNERGLP